MRIDMLAIAHNVLHSRLDVINMGVVATTLAELQMIAQTHNQISKVYRFLRDNGETAPLSVEAEFGLQCTAFVIELLKDYKTDCVRVIEHATSENEVFREATKGNEMMDSAIEYFTGLANTYMN